MNSKESFVSFNFPCIKVSQPLGDFYIASLPYKRLCEITEFDVRRLIEERGFETYLGIQRPLKSDRVKEIEEYVNTVDACFPTSVILAVSGACADYDEKSGLMSLHNIPDPPEGEEMVLYRQIAKVLDGQHRIEALKACKQQDFDINLSIFIDADIADQAYIFSTVNLAQTKVNKSLVMDLFDLAKSRSPQKVAHHVVVALDQTSGSPFYKKIKRLGVSTVGRDFETIAQATFTEELLAFLCKDKIQQMKDRDLYKRGKIPERINQEESNKLIFRNMFIDNKDNEITDVVWNYFAAVGQRWPEAWASTGQGIVLNKTNGFKALMRFMRLAYLHCVAPGEVPSDKDFYDLFDKIKIDDKDFNTTRYSPGSSGQAQMFNDFVQLSGVKVK